MLMSLSPLFVVLLWMLVEATSRMLLGGAALVLRGGNRNFYRTSNKVFAGLPTRFPTVFSSNRKISSSSFATANDDEGAVTMDVHVMDTQGMEDYIHEIISTLRKSSHDKNDTVDGDWKLTLNEKHRSKMMRAILGLSKVEFKQRLRELEQQYQWDLADTFVRQHLQALTDKNVMGLFDKAPNFSTAVDQYISSDPSQQQSFTTAAKLFSSMARGRMYQGKM